MAVSPSHRFGQIIGDVLEEAVLPLLEIFANEHSLYLDKKGYRSCRVGSKCSWTDLNGNKHDLDFVLEQGGSSSKRGVPVAFIETAWRRYTKHSRNKAQEIQGAVMPLVQTYKNAGPFTGAVLAGVFTDGALQQLRSLGFQVLYIQYESIVAAFAKHGIDARFNEDTADAEFAKKVTNFDALTSAQRRNLAGALLEAHKKDVEAFMDALKVSVSRQIERIVVLPLHGRKAELKTVQDAISFIQGYDQSNGGDTFERYEIQIRYNNGNEINGMFNDKSSAVAFLQGYLPLAST